jgi:hypothetical protein
MARLFQPPQRKLHALTPELWEDKRAASQSACLPPQTAQTLGREVCAHRRHSNPRPPFGHHQTSLKTVLLSTKKKKFIMNIRELGHEPTLTHYSIIRTGYTKFRLTRSGMDVLGSTCMNGSREWTHTHATCTKVQDSQRK